MSSRPNVLVFLTDDHGQWAVGCYGNPAVKSPTMDFLARDGVRMDAAFTPSPVCSPARACFYTGRLPSQHGIHDWLHEPLPEIQKHPALTGQLNLGQLLQRAGYQTAQIGKWHCGTSWEPKPGFDRWFSYGEFQFPHRGPIKFSDQGRLVEETGYQTPVITDQAIDFLRTRDQQKPFFMFVGYVDTHTPYRDHPDRLVDQYRQHDFAEIPRETFSSAHGFANFGWGFPPNSPAEREARAQYYAAVSMIDAQMGRILDELDSQGQLDNTLVIYTADHGNMCGQHGLNTKGNATVPQNFIDDSSIRIPMLLRLPKVIPAGQTNGAIVDLMDLHQTILDVAGAVPDEATRRDINSPGCSFWPLITGAAPVKWRDAYFGEYGNARCIRTATAKLIRRGPGPNGQFPDEFYDLRQDPRERTNRIAEPAAQSQIADLTRRLEEYFARYEIPARSGWNIAGQPRTSKDMEPWYVFGKPRDSADGGGFI